jgi:RHS repeat-associated protein
MIKAIFRLIALCVFIISVPVKAGVAQYSPFTDAAGNIYLKAPDNFVLIHTEVSIPLLVPPKNGLLKLSLVNGSWVVQELTLSQWNALNLTPGNASVDQLRFGDIDGDGVLDLVMTLNNSNPSALSLTNLKGSIAVRALNTGYLSSAFVLSDVNSDGIMDIVDNDTVLLGQRNGEMLYTGQIKSSADGTNTGLTAAQFRVDESGQATYQIPIAIPAGIAGVQPEISLSYNSGAGEGIAGMGWNISGLSSIQRCAKSIVQDGAISGVFMNANDGYCLDGQRLILTGGTYGKAGSTYRLEIDDFSVITAIGQDTSGTGPAGFEVKTKANEIMYFGNTSFTTSDADAFVEPGGKAAGSVASSWALKGIKDGYGNYIEYLYRKGGIAIPGGSTIESDGVFVIDRIRYTGTSSATPFASINFNYDTHTYARKGFTNGGTFYQKYRLGSISVELDGDEYRFYDLAHDSGQFSYLDWVQECQTSNKSSCRNPLKFDYHKQTNSLAFGTSFPMNSRLKSTTQFFDINGDGNADMVYTSSDGKTLYVKMSTSSGSYSSEEIVTSNLSSAELINFVDVNGDGNMDIFYPEGSAWKFAIYQPTTVTVPVTCPPSKVVPERICDVGDSYEYSYTFAKTTVPGWAYNSGSLETYKNRFFADVNGDGLMDWVGFSNQALIAYLNVNKTFATTATTLFTIPASVWNVGAATIVASRWVNSEKAPVGDFNGDGLSDMIVKLTANGYLHGGCMPQCAITEHKYILLYSKGQNDYGYQDFSLSGTDHRTADLNGDGLSDLMYIYGTGWRYQLSTGQMGSVSSAFGPAVSLALSSSSISADYKHLVQLADLDNNGKADILAPGAASKMEVFKSNFDSNGDFYFGTAQSLSALLTLNKETVIRLADINADGDTDLIFTNSTAAQNASWTAYHSNMSNVQNMPSPASAADIAGIPKHQLRSVTNGYGVTTEISYQPMTNAAVYTAEPTLDSTGALNSDYISPKYGMWLVNSVVSESNTNGSIKETVGVSYKYAGFRLHKKGHGSLGFDTLTTKDLQSDIETTTKYNQNWPFIGRPIKTTSMSGSLLVSEATSNWAQGVSANGGAYVYLESSVEKGWQIDSAGERSFVSHVETSNVYDKTTTGAALAAWGNLTKSIVKLYDESGSLVHTTESSHEYAATNVADYLRYGRLSKSVVTKLQSATSYQAALSQNRVSSFAYNSTGYLQSETVASECATTSLPASLSSRGSDGLYCDNSNVSTKSYVYDKFGNIDILTVTAAGVNRSEQTTYSDDGRFVITKTNALGQQEQYLYNGQQSPRGLVYSVTSTGPNGISSTTHMDGWGQGFRVTSADGNISTTETLFCADSSFDDLCGTRGVLITTTITPGAPTTFVVTDGYGRKVRQVTTTFDSASSYSYVDFIYDKHGNLTQQSDPYFSSVNRKLTTFTFDKFQRPIKVEYPDTVASEVKYFGLRTSSKDENGFWRDEIKDVSGRVLKTTDPYASTATNPVAPSNTGYVQFTYSAFGDQLSQKVNVYENNALVTVSTTHSYDKYGRKLHTNDPTKGIWYYGYNGFGEQIVQVNARNEMSKLEYNTLGQLTAKLQQRSVDEGGGFDKTCYSYGNSPSQKNVGKLIKTAQYTITADSTCTALSATTARYSETQTYDLYGRPASSEQKHSGKSFSQATSYDTYGRVSQQVLPLGRVITLGYQNGYQKGVYEFPGGALLSEVESMDAAGRVTKEKLYGNTSRATAFDANRGFVDSISVSAGERSVYNVSYDYDNKGTTELRTSQYHDKNGTGTMTITEDFVYTTEGHSRLKDRLMTVTNAALGNNVSNLTQSFSYDALGNIKTKTGAGTYSYNAANPYKLATVSGGSRAYTMAYDTHGNITSDSQRTFSYSSADMPLKITQGSTITEFAYGPDNQRFYRKDSRTENGVATTTETFYAGKVYEQHHKKTGSQTAPSIEHRWYIGPVVITNFENTGAEQYEVLHGDALGSTVAVTDGSGQLKAHYLYDAWGKQSQIMTGFVGTNPIAPAASRRAYTGHENVEGLDIIHMNGRIYDATLARFMQADPFVQAPTNTQSYNRYSYVLNNPLSYTDPSGYLFKSIGKFVKKNWRVIVAAIATYATYGAASNWAIGWGMGTAATATTAATLTTTGAMLAGAAAGFVGGAINSGSLKGALHGALSGAAFGGIGQSLSNAHTLQQIGAHALAGGIMSDLQGGKFGHGFISAGFTKWTGKAWTLNSENVLGNSLKQALVGGTVSTLTGGKFANGAYTAALQYIVNEAHEYVRNVDYNQIWSDVKRGWNDYWDDVYGEEVGLTSSAIARGCGGNTETCVAAAKKVQEYALFAEMGATAVGAVWKPADKIATGFKVAGDIGFAVETALAPSVGNFVPKLMSSMVENRLAPLVSHKIINESVGKLGAQATDGLSGIMMNSGGN